MSIDIIVLPWVIFVVFWGVGFLVEQMAEHKKHSALVNITMGILGALSFSIFIILFLFFFFYSNIYFFGAVLFSRSLISESIGFLISIIGLALALWGRLTLGMNWSRDPLVTKSSKLITKGPYGIVRHPIYSGAIAMFLGTAIYLGLLGGFIGLIVGLLGIFWKTRLEEKELIKQFPKDYSEYKKHARAFIPFIY